MIIFNRFHTIYPYDAVPALMRQLEKEGRLELLEAVRERYATMKPDQRMKVIHHDKRTATGVEANKDTPTTP